MNKQSISTGTIWETKYGFCRAVRVDERILVSGTTATDAAGCVVGEGDAAVQARFILDKIERAIVALGGQFEDIVRTRVYVCDLLYWEPAAMVHGERFAHIRPANTLVEARLVGEQYLVEIEAEAMIGAGDAL